MTERYIIDSTALTYILEGFPHKLIEDVWNAFLDQCDDETVISAKETKKILDLQLVEEESVLWVNEHSKIFKAINQKESEKLGELVSKKLFDFYDSSPEFARKLPVSIPFIFAIAIVQKRKIVICKTCKDKKKIMSICDTTGVKYVFAEDYLILIKQSRS